jgi:26S proteasome regulatory subunit N7
VSSGKKIDATMQKCRVALFYLDLDVARTLVAEGKKLVDDGGDWDRRNRLKMYDAVVLMLDRDFKAAAALLLETIPTFTCTELCTYERFVQYAIVTNLLFLGRPELKKKIVDGPEVLGVIGSLPPLSTMVNGLYDCEYAAFFSSLLDLETELLKDRYLARNAR